MAMDNNAHAFGAALLYRCICFPSSLSTPKDRQQGLDHSCSFSLHDNSSLMANHRFGAFRYVHTYELRVRVYMNICIQQAACMEVRRRDTCCCWTCSYGKYINILFLPRNMLEEECRRKEPINTPFAVYGNTAAKHCCTWYHTAGVSVRTESTNILLFVYT